MNRWQHLVESFHHQKSGQAAPTRIDFSDWPGDMRIALMREELSEIEAAWLLRCGCGGEHDEPREAEIIDGLVDLLYVTIGSAVSAGVDLEPFFELVHAANMSKVDGSIGPKRFRADGKILKPEGWKPPDVLGLLRRLKEAQR